MNNSIYNFPLPSNEPILEYLKGSKERVALEVELERQSNTVVEIPLIIDGKEIYTGNTSKVVMPHNHSHTLAIYHKAGEKEVQMAIDAAMRAHNIWNDLAWTVRASIMLKIADLLSVKHRALI
ncbi:MAG: aldehyde dehydrogenase family protein, partial [Bacteroidales bacterium]|nr:aldehyde dehydrogenase family protein [Bacteroidales bacterium]